MDKIIGKSAICEKGHLQTSVLKHDEPFISKYCSQCGKKIIDCCPYCKAYIKGGLIKKTEIITPLSFYEDDVEYKEETEENLIVPNYCTNCGKPFPWIEEFLENYKELLDIEDQEFKEKIYRTTENLLKDKFSKDSIYLVLLKKQISKAPAGVKALIIQVLTGIATSGVLDYLKK